MCGSPVPSSIPGSHTVRWLSIGGTVMAAVHPPTTQAGRERLEALLTRMLEVERPALVAAALVQQGGDAADVAGGVQAQESLARLDDRVRAVQEQLTARAPRVTEPVKGVVAVGSTVTVDFGDGPERLVIGTAGDVAAGQDVITVGSPLGAALLGKKAKAEISFTGPTGRPVAVRLTAVK